jgi:hypothetical protein
VHETKQGFFLCDLGYERNLFCKLTTVKIDHGKLATGRQLEWSSTTVGIASSGDVVCGGSSSKHRIGMGGSGVEARRRWHGLAMAARVWAKIHMG